MGGHKKYKSKSLKVIGCFSVAFWKITTAPQIHMTSNITCIFYQSQKLVNSCKQVSKLFERLTLAYGTVRQSTVVFLCMKWLKNPSNFISKTLLVISLKNLIQSIRGVFMI